MSEELQRLVEAHRKTMRDMREILSVVCIPILLVALMALVGAWVSEAFGDCGLALYIPFLVLATLYLVRMLMELGR